MSEAKCRKSWEDYANSWRPLSREERLKLFHEALVEKVVYSDPKKVTNGHSALADYMEEFQQHTPDGWFEITKYQCHHNQSLSHWNMKSAEGIILGVGISYAQYNENGKLTRITGFFGADTENETS